jgi:hypothetical protein
VDPVERARRILRAGVDGLSERRCTLILFERVFEQDRRGTSMRRYADPVEVRRGHVDAGGEGPEQFLWRGRLWKVRAVLAHWVETSPWWQSTAARSALGDESPRQETESASPPRPSLGDLLTERELWRVEAGRGRPRTYDHDPDGQPEVPVSGVFELSFDWADGRWLLVGCSD